MLPLHNLSTGQRQLGCWCRSCRQYIPPARLSTRQSIAPRRPGRTHGYECTVHGKGSQLQGPFDKNTGFQWAILDAVSLRRIPILVMPSCAMLLPACQPFSGSASLLPPPLHSLQSVARPSARCIMRPATASHAASALVSGTKGDKAFPEGEARCQATLALPPSSPPQTSLLNLLPSACVEHKPCSTLALPTFTLPSAAPCPPCVSSLHTAPAHHYRDPLPLP